MRATLLHLLRSPVDCEPLDLYVFDSLSSIQNGEDDILEGILVADRSKRAYAITGGVPVMLESSFTREFLDRHQGVLSRNEALSRLHLGTQLDGPVNWSFSTEWNYHFDSGLTTTWGWKIDERVQQFFLETDLSSDEIQGKWILDAGCGNGQLSEALSKSGARVVAMDYSSSVFKAERVRKSPEVYFVRGDLQAPPFGHGAFDVIISNGVIHHTRNTAGTFSEVAKLVATGGRFYVWVYRKPETFVRRYVQYPMLDLMRVGTSRLPDGPQAIVVNAYAAAVFALQEALGRGKGRSWQERIVGAYDGLSPRWRHYHTPLEVSGWFFANGYSQPKVTHWDNPYGFGMMAIKTPQPDTPGVNFGKKRVDKRYWQ